MTVQRTGTTTQGADGPRLRHDDWMRLAGSEYGRLLDLLRSLEPAEWQRPTDCPEWDVREVVAHLVGAAEGNARVRESARQARRGRGLVRPGEDLIDGMTRLQVTERRDLRPADLVQALTDVTPRALRARRRLPALVRAVPVPFGPPLGTKPIGYLMDRIYTRDVWMHRIDIARATGRELVVTPDHDGVLAADVAGEWMGLHGRPCRLVLTGPAGGVFGAGGETIEVDAVEFCRIVSGRGSATGLLETRVPF